MSCALHGAPRPWRGVFVLGTIGESKLGRLVDALALGGDEGRDKQR